MVDKGRLASRAPSPYLLPALLLFVCVSFQPSPGLGRSSGAASFLPFPGGLLETPGTGLIRPRLPLSEIQALLPARGAFLFPPPYGTAAARITNAGDCGGGDCVDYVGYSYWRNINNHAGQDEMLIMLGLNRARGGPGPSLFRYDKTTDQVTSLGPLFDPSSPLSFRSGEGWYWSATQPTQIYLDNGPQMQRYDVMTRQTQTVLDVASGFGSDKIIRQMHSSDDDRVHSATMLARPDYRVLGCVVYHEDTGQFQYFPKIGGFDECHLDKSGRWLMSLENVDGKYDTEMRVFDLLTGNERRVWDHAGAVGHADMGYGYVVGADNWNVFPNAVLRWDFSEDPLSGVLVSHNFDGLVPAPNHIAHGNARPDVGPNLQYACGSGATRAGAVWANEIICFRLDGALEVLVVAPVMTDLDAPGGGNDYAKAPKGNLDVTGQYFLWTSNSGGDRLDAFIVKVPAHLLLEAPARADPPSLSVSGAPDPVAAGGSITYRLSYSNQRGADLTGVVIRDRVPPDTTFLSATAGGAVSSGVVTWAVGALPAGASGSVQMTVGVSPSLQAGALIVNGTGAIGSNETSTTTSPAATTRVVTTAAPIVAAAVEAGTNSIYVPRSGSWTIRIDGANFQDGTVVDLGSDISQGPASLTGTGRLTVPIMVSSTAVLGPRTATVTNPDGLSGSKPGALVVVKWTDINLDCRIDAPDLNLLAQAWNNDSSEPRFNAAADLDGDDYVGPLDLAILAEYFGQRLSVCP